ncbi:MAG: hypothetical protein EGP68_11600 [Lachnospiraceae bacterium]|nr:hypothetical protein [Lachnospiraceae bacterium]
MLRIYVFISWEIKTLREDRTAAEWKNVACATRRRRRILLRRILFHRKNGCAGVCRQAVAAHSIKGKDRKKT